jgi:5-methylcytosine-specific restriction endonuclease McrA
MFNFDEPRELHLDGREVRREIDERLAERLELEQAYAEPKEPRRPRLNVDGKAFTPTQREKLRVYVNRERAGGNLSAECWTKIVAAFCGHCAYCDTLPKLLVMDHVVPVAQGGTTVDYNVVPACRRCNLAKGARRPEAWLGEQEFDEFMGRWPFAISYHPETAEPR